MESQEPTLELQRNIALERWINASFVISFTLLIVLCALIVIRCVQVRRLTTRQRREAELESLDGGAEQRSPEDHYLDQ